MMASYSLEPLMDDCYENSTVLINKFDIKDEEKLDTLERSITSMQIARAFIDISFENVDFEFYKQLHKYVSRGSYYGICSMTMPLVLHNHGCNSLCELLTLLLVEMKWWLYLVEKHPGFFFRMLFSYKFA